MEREKKENPGSMHMIILHMIAACNVRAQSFPRLVPSFCASVLIIPAVIGISCKLQSRGWAYVTQTPAGINSSRLIVIRSRKKSFRNLIASGNDVSSDSYGTRLYDVATLSSCADVFEPLQLFLVRVLGLFRVASRCGYTQTATQEVYHRCNNSS